MKNNSNVLCKIFYGVFLALILFCLKVNAQSDDIIQQVSISYEELTEAQQIVYNQLLEGIDYVDTLYFVSVGSFDDDAYINGEIEVNLPFLKWDTLKFHVNIIDYPDENNYKWAGTLNETTLFQDTIRDTISDRCTVGTLTLLSVDGRRSGSLTLEDDSYIITDLTDGLQVMIKRSYPPEFEAGCKAEIPSEPPVDPYIQSTEPCIDHTLKILIFYSASALATGLNPYDQAAAGLLQFQTALGNSDIYYRNNNFEIVGVLALENVIGTTWGESWSSIGQDVIDFSEMPLVSGTNGVRESYGADVCVLLTKGNYHDINNSDLEFWGVSKWIGPQSGTIDGAWSIVEIDHTTDDYSFAHEIGHVLGARHDIGDDNSQYAPSHAREFTGSYNIWHLARHHYRTICKYRNHPSGYYHFGEPTIPYFTNPNIYYLGSYQTGTNPYYNSVPTMENNRAIVEDYYYEYTGIPEAHISSQPHVACEDHLDAEVNVTCGTEPYTYQWYKSSNGINYTILTGETSSTLSYTIDPYILIPHAWFFKCEITDASPANWSSIVCIPVRPCGNGPRVNNNDNLITNITLSPNPVSEILNLHLESYKGSEAQIEIVNLLGDKICDKRTIQIASGKDVVINTRSYPSGFYIIKIITSNSVNNLPFIVYH